MVPIGSRPWLHWLTSISIVISGLTSAWFVVSANSWMNSPTGFQIMHGQVTGIDPFAAILNPSTPYETTHMILACYVITGFGVAAVYAVGMLAGKRDAYHRNGLLLGMAVGFAAIPFQILSGDFNARAIETLQPPKYAAMEGVLQSGYGLPLYIGGFVDEQSGQVYYAIQIPHGESLIAHFDLNSFTRGLLSFPSDQRPPLATFVHLSFDGMVACAFYMFFAGALFCLRKSASGLVPEQKWLLWCIAIAGPCAFLAMELGWMVTEEWQPWVVYGLVRTRDAIESVAVDERELPGLLLHLRGFGNNRLDSACAHRLARRRKPPQQLSELIEGMSAEQERSKKGVRII